MTIKEMQEESHRKSIESGWYGDRKEDNAYVIPALMALIHSEISEALEGHRKDLMDDKLPHRKMVEVELADAIIRIGDLAEYMGLDLQGAIEEKWAYNAKRADHKPENRAKVGGKKF